MDILSNVDILRTLSNRDMNVYLLMRDWCYKGKKIHNPRPISTNALAKHLNLSYQQTRKSIEHLVNLKLFDKYTTTFLAQHGNKKLWTKTSYYRLT